MTDIVTREEREELRRLWEGENRAALAAGDSEEWEIVARVLAGRMFLALPRLLDTIDALEAENARLRGIAVGSPSSQPVDPDDLPYDIDDGPEEPWCWGPGSPEHETNQCLHFGRIE